MAKRVSDGPEVPVKKNYCFGCGPDNPDSMRLKFRYDKKRGLVSSRISVNPRFAGPPGYVHGGIIATILDEAMAKLNKLHGVTAVTGHLAVDYLRPVPLEKSLLIVARETNVKGRRRLREAEITNQKKEVMARGTGLFVTVNPEKVFAKG